MLSQDIYRRFTAQKLIIATGFLIIGFLSSWLGFAVPTKAAEESEQCQRVWERSEILWKELNQLNDQLTEVKRRFNKADLELQWRRMNAPAGCTPGLDDLTDDFIRNRQATTECQRYRKEHEFWRQETLSAIEEYRKLFDRHNTDTQELDGLEKTLVQCAKDAKAVSTKAESSTALFEGDWRCAPGMLKITGSAGKISGEGNQGWGPKQRDGGDLSNVKGTNHKATMDVKYGDKTKGTFTLTLGANPKTLSASWFWDYDKSSGTFSCKR